MILSNILSISNPSSKEEGIQSVLPIGPTPDCLLACLMPSSAIKAANS